MTPNGRGLKVLVADADRTVLELVQIRLDVAGYHACVERTGPAVLETLKNIRPGLMILDMDLPEMSGFEVLEALTRRGEKLPCPTLVVGRKLAIEDVKRAISLGARDCMAKPFSGAQVLDRVSRMLKPASAAPPAIRRPYYVDTPGEPRAQA
jgi:DNA-binding response OmpR family regulator